MTPDEDTITPEQWRTDSSVGKDTQSRRTYVLRMLAQTNLGLEGTVDQLLAKVKDGTLSLYQASRKFIDQCRADGMLPSTVALYRSTLPAFWISVLGEENFKQSKFDRLIPRGDDYVSRTKGVPTVDQLKEMLRIANSRDRAMIATLCSGMRIGEVLSLKMKQIEIRKGGYGRIKLTASATKARVWRYVFLTKETVDFINRYHTLTTSEWLFPGELGNHLQIYQAWNIVKYYFKKVGLVDTESEIYSPHSYRTFADSQMAKCGLDRKYIALIISHKSRLGAEENYKDWDTIETEWKDKCEQKMTWLTETIVVTQPDPELQKKVTNLESVVKTLLEAMMQRKLPENSDLVGIAKLAEGAVKKLLPDKTPPTCACGHLKGEHYGDGAGRCLVYMCSCVEFRDKSN